MPKPKAIFIVLLLPLSLPARAESIEITITQAEQYYFREVDCASDSAALIKIFSADSEKFSDEVLKLTSFSEEHYTSAINAGLKTGRTENQIKQFIQLQTDNSVKSNNKFIKERGFEKFQKSAISGLYAICRNGQKN